MNEARGDGRAIFLCAAIAILLWIIVSSYAELLDVVRELLDENTALRMARFSGGGSGENVGRGADE